MHHSTPATVYHGTQFSIFCFVQTAEHPLTMIYFMAMVAVACLLSPAPSARADDSSLPSDWRTGIATNYGGAQDGKACLSALYMLPS